MDNTREREIQVLKLEKEAIRNKIFTLQLEERDVEDRIFELEWKKISWDDLIDWLKKNGSDIIRNNPMVISKHNRRISYCKLSKEGELMIGGYINNDHFKRGENLYVSYYFKPYSEYK